MSGVCLQTNRSKNNTLSNVISRNRKKKNIGGGMLFWSLQKKLIVSLCMKNQYLKIDANGLSEVLHNPADKKCSLERAHDFPSFPKPHCFMLKRWKKKNPESFVPLDSVFSKWSSWQSDQKMVIGEDIHSLISPKI